MSKHSVWYIVLAAVLVLSFALAGCAPKAAAPAPAPPDLGAGRRTHHGPRLRNHRSSGCSNPLRRQPPKHPSRLL